MFDIEGSGSAAGLRSTIVDVVTHALTALQAECGDDAARIDRIRAVDRAVAALAAAQVADSVDFSASQMREQEQLGVPVRRRGRGIADQIGLATKRSPTVASRRLADARTPGHRHARPAHRTCAGSGVGVGGVDRGPGNRVPCTRAAAAG